MNTRRPPVLLALLALSGVVSAQTTWYVDAGGTPPGDGSQGNPYTSLQHCFAHVSTVDGDTVLVAPGTYVESLDLLGKSLDVRSTAGAATTTLRPAGLASALKVIGVADARFEGFTFRDGSGTTDGTYRRGGAVFCSASTLELVDCVLRDSQAGFGGNLCVQDGSAATLIDCLLEGGTAWQGAGAHVEGAALIAHGTAFTTNRPPEGSGGFLRRGVGLHSIGGATLELYGCSIDSNLPTSGYTFQGAGLYHEGPGSALLDGCTVSSNGRIDAFWDSWGGGVYAAGPVTLTGSTISENLAVVSGGGVYGTADNLQLFDCDLVGNYSFQGGGAYGASLEGCRLVENRASTIEGACGGDGGGASHSTLVGCTLEGNVARGRAGGAYYSTLTECELVGNRLDANGPCAGPIGGGGIWGGSATDCTFRDNVVRRISTPAMSIVSGGAAGNATLTRCLLEGNAVDASNSSFYSGYGGGAYDCTLVDCTLVGNRAFGPVGGGAPRGGGIYGGSATGCTFVGNEADSLPGAPLAAGGGAANATLVRCVLVGNVADHGGAAWHTSLSRCSTYGNVASQAGGGLSLHPSTGPSWGTETARETIFWGNEPDELEVGAGTLTAEYCDILGGWPGLGNVGADPEYWNGPAADLHLRPGSPCIGAGDPTLPLDPDGSAREIGAFVFDDGYVGGPYVYCEAKPTSQGCVPSIGFHGEPTLGGPDDFVLEATQVRSLQNGILFWGLAPAEAPFYGGLRCVGPPIVRTPPASSGGSGVPCSGVLSFAFTHAYALGAGLSAGDRVFAQFWFRDPGHPDGTNVGLSDALDFTLLP